MNKVRRVQINYQDPEFPAWNHPQTAMGFIVGVLLWILMVIAFLFLFYVQLIRYYTHYLLTFIKNPLPAVPFWLAIVVGVFLPPLALAVIVIGAVAKLLNE